MVSIASNTHFHYREHLPDRDMIKHSLRKSKYNLAHSKIIKYSIVSKPRDERLLRIAKKQNIVGGGGCPWYLGLSSNLGS